MATTMIPILSRVHAHTNAGRLTHLTGTVFQVSGSFNTDDPLLWKPLFTPEARAQAFRDNKGRCLNCHGTDHSFKRCPQPFINGSGCLNPRLGQLGDNGQAYRRWQQRMRSYQRRDTRSSSSSDRRRNSSRRNDNNRNRNNHGGNPHEPPRNNSRNNGQGNYSYGSSPNAGSHAPPPPRTRRPKRRKHAAAFHCISA